MAVIDVNNAQIVISMDWAEIKNISSSKNMLLQSVENEDSFILFCLDESILYKCVIWKQNSIATGIPAYNASNLQDYQNNYASNVNKSLIPRNSSGYPINAPSFLETNGAIGQIFGVSWTTPAGTQSFNDIVVVNQIHIQGGEGWVVGANKGDYTEFSIVDKDNVTGMFDGTNSNGMNQGLTNLGLSVGTDILELNKYVKKKEFRNGDQEFKVEFESKADVYPGLYLRASYVSTGTTDIDCAVTYKWYED